MQGMRLMLIAILVSTLTACNSEFLDFEFAFSINEEEVFSTQSSIEETLAETGDDPEYTQTQYPIVLVHGLYGFDKILGVDYWYRVAEAIELGGGEVYTLPVPKLNSTWHRGEYLLEALQDLSAQTGHARFHLQGHSHGGPTVRYIIDTAPDLLASVTTIGGLNMFGVDDIDEYVDALESFFPGIIGQGMLNGLAELIELLGGNEQNHESFALASFRSFTPEAVLEFNQSHNLGLPNGWQDNTYGCVDGTDTPIDGAHSENVAGNDIFFYSWSGTGIKTNVLDPTDLLVAYTAEQLNVPESDGMVERCTSHFGRVIRSDYDLNHLDQMNWVFALRRATATNPLSIYRIHSNRLKQLEIDEGL